MWTHENNNNEKIQVNRCCLAIFDVEKSLLIIYTILYISDIMKVQLTSRSNLWTYVCNMRPIHYCACSLCTVCMCLLSEPFCVALYWQCGHGNGRSPVWVLMCLLRSVTLDNTRKQIRHVEGVNEWNSVPATPAKRFVEDCLLGGFGADGDMRRCVLWPIDVSIPWSGPDSIPVKDGRWRGALIKLASELDCKKRKMKK